MTIPIYTSLQKRTDKFLKKAKEVHKNKYDYSIVEYIGSYDLVNIICPEHGAFPQRPNHHLNGIGCKKCGIIYRAEKKKSKAAREFSRKAKEVHKNKYDYSIVEYIKSDKIVDIICPSHCSFPQRPADHLSGQGCPQCSKSNYSKIAIKWMNSISSNIQHAENGGEYRIPTTRYRVDGYNKDTNTVYEFHGDVYHGNPELFSPDDNCHPFNKVVTARELYDKTIQREDYIKSLGYNLVVMWEQEYIKSQNFK